MAIVTQGFELSISVVDSGANRSTLSWKANTAVVIDFATAQAQRDLLVTDLVAITDSVVESTRLTEVQYEDTLVYPATAQNENKASITYLIDGTNKKGNLKVPAPKIAIFVETTGPNSNIVDTANGIVVNYTDNFRSTAGWFISDGESIITVLKGKRVHAKNNNG